MNAPESANAPAATEANAEENNESTAIFHATTDESKALATLKARFAFCGYATHDLADSGHLVTRFDLIRYCADVRDLNALAAALGIA
jgi:hypothetical protein